MYLFQVLYIICNVKKIGKHRLKKNIVGGHFTSILPTSNISPVLEPYIGFNFQKYIFIIKYSYKKKPLISRCSRKDDCRFVNGQIGLWYYVIFLLSESIDGAYICAQVHIHYLRTYQKIN